MYHSVKEVIPRDDYTLFLVFENGGNGVFNMKPILDFGVFQRIKDLVSSSVSELPSIQLSGIAESISIRNIYTQNARKDQRPESIDSVDHRKPCASRSQERRGRVRYLPIAVGILCRAGCR